MPARVALALALAAVLGAAIPALAAKDPVSLEALKTELHARYPDVRTLTADDLRRWQADSARAQPVLLDARSRDEYNVSRLPGAVLAQNTAAALRALDGRAKDAPVVVYCSVGYRSAVLARTLGKRGYTNVANLDGSLFEWANRGFPLEPARVPPAVHPYDQQWGRYLDSALWSTPNP
jgi:rhodanese-related sulfurtransferase